MSRRVTENVSNKIHDETEAASAASILKEKDANEIDKKTMKGQEIPQDNSQLIQEDGSRASIDMKTKRKRALSDLRCIVEDAIVGDYLLEKPDKSVSPTEAAMAKGQLKNITLWGVPLLPSAGHQGTDVVLLKFLKAREFKVQEAFHMLRKNLQWRREYNTDSILEENLDPDHENFMYLNCKDKEGRPLCYNDFGTLKDKELSKKILETEEFYDKFIRLRVQSMEKGVKELSFKPGGPNTLVHITDLKNSHPPALKESRLVSKKILMLLQDNYPELIHKNVSFNKSIEHED